MSDETVLKHVVLTSDHSPTGDTIHRRNGCVVSGTTELHIVQFDGEPGFYLLHFDDDGRELTDTLHDTIDGAMKQAESEFGIDSVDWIDAKE